jgi:hypothetical protein
LELKLLGGTLLNRERPHLQIQIRIRGHSISTTGVAHPMQQKQKEGELPYLPQRAFAVLGWEDSF